jgi:hypothetical protein
MDGEHANGAIAAARKGSGRRLGSRDGRENGFLSRSTASGFYAKIGISGYSPAFEMTLARALANHCL